MGMPIDQQQITEDIIINIPSQPDRLDKILNYLGNAPTEVQIVAIIGLVLLVITFLKSDLSNFITKRFSKNG